MLAILTDIKIFCSLTKFMWPLIQIDSFNIDHMVKSLSLSFFSLLINLNFLSLRFL